MFSRFDDNEPGLSLKSKLYQVDQERGEPIEEFAELVRCMAVKGFPSLGRGRIICSRVLSQRTWRGGLP